MLKNLTIHNFYLFIGFLNKIRSSHIFYGWFFTIYCTNDNIKLNYSSIFIHVYEYLYNISNCERSLLIYPITLTKFDLYCINIAFLDYNLLNLLMDCFVVYDDPWILYLCCRFFLIVDMKSIVLDYIVIK